MNDFTKEELTALLVAFKGDCKAFSNYEFDEALEIKIQSMIDNYCEILIPKMDKYCCMKCHEILLDCECEV